MDLVIVRHGRPQRIEGADGPADPPLTDIGREQAETVARFLIGEGIDHVVTSPMRRARETAAPLALALGIDAEVVDDLAEIDSGSDSYLPMEELKAEGGAAWAELIADPSSLYPGVDVEVFSDRVTAAFDALVVAHPGRTVAAFCHGMTTMGYLRRIVGYDDPWALRTDYASLTRVQASAASGIRSVRSVNETAHLGPHRIVSP